MNGTQMLRLARETARILESHQDRLRACKWSDGESNTEGDFARLACEAAVAAWKNIGDSSIQLSATPPDISCIFTFPDSTTAQPKIELKTSRGIVMPGSTIGKLDINQPMIYCLRGETFKIRYSQYHSAMGESETDLFQDRTPRPAINFNKMVDSSVAIEHIEKEKSVWVDHYASSALHRINTNLKSSWQDDLVRKILKQFVESTSVEEFARMKGSPSPSEPLNTPVTAEQRSQ